MIATAGPCRSIRRREQRRDLLRVEEGHRPLDVALAGHRQDELAVEQPSGLAHGDVAEERSDRGQSGIPAARTVAPGGLDVQEEFADQVGIEVFDPELRWNLAPLLAGEPQEEPERVAVTRDRMCARLHLRAQAFGEEALKQRRGCRGGQSRPPSTWTPPTRCAVRLQGSGTASEDP